MNNPFVISDKEDEQYLVFDSDNEYYSMVKLGEASTAQIQRILKADIPENYLFVRLL